MKIKMNLSIYFENIMKLKKITKNIVMFCSINSVSVHLYRVFYIKLLYRHNQVYVLLTTALVPDCTCEGVYNLEMANGSSEATSLTHGCFPFNTKAVITLEYSPPK